MITETQDLISIAICTYNGEKHLEKQLDSVISQTYRPIEIIVCDDLSTDGTSDILNKYAAEYAMITIHRNEKNLGFIKNFEKAISYCTGVYIALCDQDDIWRSDKLAILMDKKENYDLIYHDSSFIDNDGKAIGNMKMSDHYRVYDGTSNLPFLISNCVAGHAMLFKRSLLSIILPFEKRFYHDWWITFAAVTTGKIKAIPDVLVKYRQHGFSITDSLSLKSANHKPVNKGYLNFDLEWISHCLNFGYNTKNPKEIKNIYKHLASYNNGEKGFKLFLFLLRYYHILFYFHLKEKGILSRLNTIRKICF